MTKPKIMKIVLKMSSKVSSSFLYNSLCLTRSMAILPQDNIDLAIYINFFEY